MKLNFKGFNNTSLCDRCKYSQIVVTAQGERIVQCEVFYGGNVPPNVTECNKYLQLGHATEYEMEKQAWILEVKKGQPMGFKPPKGEKE